MVVGATVADEVGESVLWANDSPARARTAKEAKQLEERIGEATNDHKSESQEKQEEGEVKKESLCGDRRKQAGHGPPFMLREYRRSNQAEDVIELASLHTS